MNVDNIKTNGDAADFVSRCDESDTPIYVELCRIDDNIFIPIDNYGLFKKLTSYDPDLECDIRFENRNDMVIVY